MFLDVTLFNLGGEVKAETLISVGEAPVLCSLRILFSGVRWPVGKWGTQCVPSLWCGRQEGRHEALRASHSCVNTMATREQEKLLCDRSSRYFGKLYVALKHEECM